MNVGATAPSVAAPARAVNAVTVRPAAAALVHRARAARVAPVPKAIAVPAAMDPVADPAAREVPAAISVAAPVATNAVLSHRRRWS